MPGLPCTPRRQATRELRGQRWPWGGTCTPRKKRPDAANPVGDFRHGEARRTNNPPAGLAPTFEVRQREVTRFQYDPHLDPQLVWAGKAEHTSFEVDVVPLHIHERISTKAILRAVRRPQPVQPDLFGETPLPADQQIEFYKHEVGWTNRLILGDSLLVMNSLLVKEGMAGMVQMIYMERPRGIRYASNFQARADRCHPPHCPLDRMIRREFFLGAVPLVTRPAVFGYKRVRTVCSYPLGHEKNTTRVKMSDPLSCTKEFREKLSHGDSGHGCCRPSYPRPQKPKRSASKWRYG